MTPSGVRRRKIIVLLVGLAVLVALAWGVRRSVPRELPPLPPGMLNGCLVFRPVWSETKPHRFAAPVALGLCSLQLDTMPERLQLADPYGEWLLLTASRDPNTFALATSGGLQSMAVVPPAGLAARLAAGSCGPKRYVGWPVARDDGEERDFIVYELQGLSGRRLGVRLPYSAAWCIGSTPDVLYSGSGALVRHGPGGDVQSIGEGYSPAWSDQGGLAFISPDRRHIRIADADGVVSRTLDGPGTHVATVVWSPDGRFLAYTYALPLLASHYFMTWGIAVADAETGRAWGILPQRGVVADISGSHGRTMLQWVEEVLNVPHSRVSLDDGVIRR